MHRIDGAPPPPPASPPQIKMGEKLVFNAFHPDAERLFNACCNLEKVCTQLHDPTTRVALIEIQPNQPFMPMLGQQGHNLDSVFCFVLWVLLDHYRAAQPVRLPLQISEHLSSSRRSAPFSTARISTSRPSLTETACSSTRCAPILHPPPNPCALNRLGLGRSRASTSTTRDAARTFPAPTAPAPPTARMRSFSTAASTSKRLLVACAAAFPRCIFLTPYLSARSVEDCVIDGEMLVWDCTQQRLRCKGERGQDTKSSTLGFVAHQLGKNATVCWGGGG